MAYKVLDAATTTGASESIINRTRPDEFTVQGTTDGTITSATVALEGSINGTDFEELGSYDLTAGDISSESFMFHVTDRPVREYRVNVTELTLGGATSITVWVEDDAGYNR